MQDYSLLKFWRATWCRRLCLLVPDLFLALDHDLTTCKPSRSRRTRSPTAQLTTRFLPICLHPPVWLGLQVVKLQANRSQRPCLEIERNAGLLTVEVLELTTRFLPICLHPPVWSSSRRHPARWLNSSSESRTPKLVSGFDGSGSACRSSSCKRTGVSDPVLRSREMQDYSQSACTLRSGRARDGTPRVG
jgi:hypothetical protein